MHIVQISAHIYCIAVYVTNRKKYPRCKHENRFYIYFKDILDFLKFYLNIQLCYKDLSNFNI